jgi:hypothetical protein
MVVESTKAVIGFQENDLGWAPVVNGKTGTMERQKSMLNVCMEIFKIPLTC